MPSENVTYDWCWQCNSYHRTEPGQRLNTQCNPRPAEAYPPTEPSAQARTDCAEETS